MDWQKFQNRINFGITSYCNASCPLCERTIQIDNLKINHLSLKKILKNLQNLPTNMTTVILAGDFGDPLMHPDITDIIKMCNDHSKTVRIHTNGGLRNPEWFKHIGQKYPQTEIVFGIDGLDQSTNNS